MKIPKEVTCKIVPKAQRKNKNADATHRLQDSAPLQHHLEVRTKAEEIHSRGDRKLGRVTMQRLRPHQHLQLKN